ncbi:hypothetical protein AB4342_18325, partial [Vibrio breoganii]
LFGGITHRFGTDKVRYIGIALCFVTLANVNFVPSIISDAVWGLHCSIRFLFRSEPRIKH